MEGDNETGKELSWRVPRGLKLRPRSGSLMDHVQPILEKLMEDEEFTKWLDAVVNSKALEGKVIHDRGEAAKLIRKEALATGVGIVATATVAKIVNAMERLLCNNQFGTKDRLAAFLATLEMQKEASPAE